MLRQLATYDWAEVFGFAGEPNTNAGSDVADNITSLDHITVDLPFTREDVEDIYGIAEGEGDGDPWRIYGHLIDGRYFYLEAGTGYTGWDVDGSGSAKVAATRDMIERFGLTLEARRLFGFAEDNVGTIALREPRERFDAASGFTNFVRSNLKGKNPKAKQTVEAKPVELKRPRCSIMSLEVDDED